MYDLNANVNSEGGGVKVFPLGITEDVTLSNVTTDTASNGNSYLKWEFTAPDGGNVSHFEWPIDVNDDNFNSKMLNQIKRIKHIITKFVSKDAKLPKAKTFDELCLKVIALMGNNYSKIPVRLKTVYNYNNYISVPKYVPFIETMDTTPTKLTITSFDKMEKEEADNPATFSRSNNGVAKTADVDEEEVNLPF